MDWERLNGTRRGRGLTSEALGRYNSEANKVSDGHVMASSLSLINNTRLEAPYWVFLPSLYDISQA